MQKKKYIIPLVLILALAVLLIAIFTIKGCTSQEGDAPSLSETVELPVRGALPADKSALIVESAKAKPGDKNVEVIVKVVNNPGILGMDYDLYFDDAVMTLTDAQSELTLEGCTYTPPAYYKNPTTFMWDFQDANWVEDGAVLKLYFDIADDAPAGKYEIKIMYSYGNIFDADFEPIDFGVKNGYISIS